MTGFENLKVGDVVTRMLGGAISNEVVGIRNHRSNHHMQCLAIRQGDRR